MSGQERLAKPTNSVNVVNGIPSLMSNDICTIPDASFCSSLLEANSLPSGENSIPSKNAPELGPNTWISFPVILSITENREAGSSLPEATTNFSANMSFTEIVGIIKSRITNDKMLYVFFCNNIKTIILYLILVQYFLIKTEMENHKNGNSAIDLCHTIIIQLTKELLILKSNLVPKFFFESKFFV